MKVLFFLSIFFSLNIYSQKTIEPGIYLSNDGLEYITILNDTDFGYTSFLNESPYLHDQKKIKQSFCGTHIFEINKQGIGTFEIIDSKLKLNFGIKEKPLDSIKINKVTPAKYVDSSSINFKIKTYSYKELENVVLGVSIKSDDGEIDTNTGFESEKLFKLNKNQFPITFIVNDEKEITLEEPKIDYFVYLFFNVTKIGRLDRLENKSFILDQLLKIESK